MYTLARESCRSLLHVAACSFAIHGIAAAALVPALVWLAPASDWSRPGLLLLLIVLAVIADFNEVPLPAGLRFDAGLPLALITLAVLGPIPALLVDFVPIAVAALVEDEKILRAGNLAQRRRLRLGGRGRVLPARRRGRHRSRC